MFKFLKLIVTLLATALLAPLVASQGVTPPPEFNITSIGLNGSGCPPGSVYYVLSADKTAVTLRFNQFEAEAGPGISIVNNRKYCQLTLGVKVPQGFSFGIATVDYRGYYKLDAKVSATRQAIYYFAGQPQQATARSTLVGPIPWKYYLFRDSFDTFLTVTSPCGAATSLNIKSELRVSNAANPGGSGFILADDIDGSLQQTLNFRWRKC